MRRRRMRGSPPISREPITCPNCGSPHQRAYCPDCGQPRIEGRLRFRQLVADLGAQLTQWDATLPRTVRGLTIAPGRVVTEYVEGKRARYVPPFRYAVVVLALVVISMSLFGMPEMIRVSAGQEVDPELSAEWQAKMAGRLSRAMNGIVLLALPGLIVALRVLFRRSGRNLAECGVFALYLVTQSYVLTLPLAPLYPSVGESIAGLRFLILLALSILAARRFFSERGLLGPLKMGIAILFYVMVFLAVMAGWMAPMLVQMIRTGGGGG